MRKRTIALALILIVTLAVFAVPSAVAQTEIQTGTVTAYALNVRSGPGVTFDRVDLLRRGDTVTILEERNSWYRIDLDDGEGWISGRYVSTATSGSSVAGTSASSGTAASTATTGSSGGKLLFTVQLGGPIYTINANGSGPTQVATGIDPVWSPDGTQFAYIKWEMPQGIYVADADGSNARRIYDADRLRHLDWSPDGSKIAFARQKGGRLTEEERCFFGFCFTVPADAFWRIGYVEVSTGTLREQAADFHSLSPAWTPDSAQLTFRGDDPFMPRVVAMRRMAIDTSEPWTLLRENSVRNLDQCSNGKIVMDYLQHDHYEIYTANSDGSGLTQLTRHDPLSFDEPAVNASPVWSPDCSQIAFISNRDGIWRIYVMNADGSDQRPMFGNSLDSLGITYTRFDDHMIDWVE